VIHFFLGCDSAMVLRPQANGTFQVVGEAYIQGLTNAAAFLGPLPKPWRTHVWPDSIGNLRIRRYFNPETKELKTDGPRLNPLKDWEMAMVPWSNKDPNTFEWRRNKITGQVVNYDPCLRSEALKARGVALIDIELV
jgi:hypothetical protein